MDNIIDYLKACLKPKDNTEFYQCQSFDPLIFSQMKQDAIMITNSPPPDYLLLCEFVKVGQYYIIKKCFRDLAWLNTNGTFEWDTSQEPLYRRLLPPPDESVDHPLIISNIIKESEPSDKTYIEYGVRTGTTLNAIAPLVSKTFGVDIQENPYGVPSNCSFYKAFTNDFSMQILPTLQYQFAFVDADHKFESAFQDFQHLYRYIQPGGYVFLHDTYPCEKRFLDPGACNDCYKTPLAIKKAYPGIEILTLPLNPGVSIVRKPSN